MRSEALNPEGINAANGLISTVRDLAQFDLALDSALLLFPETREGAWSPLPAANGTAMPTGLGWFVQRYRDETVVWQYGRLQCVLLDDHQASGQAGDADPVGQQRWAGRDVRTRGGDLTKLVFASLFLRAVPLIR